VTHGASDVSELAWSPDGTQLALLIVPGPPGGSAAALSLEIVDRSSGTAVRVLSDNAAPIGGALRWSRDGRWISFLQNSPSKLASWLAIVPSAGGPARGVLQDDTGTVWRAEWTQAADQLLVEEVRGTQVVLRTVDLRTNAIDDWVSFAASQGNYGLSTDGRVAVYVSESPQSPADVWLVAPRESPRRLTTLNPQVSSWRLGAVRPFDWHSAQDGSIVHGLIVTPPDFAPGHPYPTIVETHPGDMPWWPGWLANWWAWGQMLATHGYVVFLPNYRGVTGQGWHSHEHLAEWGGLSYRDLIDGIDTLVRRGFADSARLGIGGWSNGGFMTEWAITHTTRFKAAVAKSAHADFVTLYASSPSSRPYLLLDFGGSPSDNRAAYDAHSPMTYVRTCVTPTLLVYGEHDVVSPSQGDEFNKALRAQHVPSELVVYPREGHGLSEYADRLDFQRRVLAWFDRYLK
jgi:dipeptidyl aminopeptidase/acylaminoacyl peptidase